MNKMKMIGAAVILSATVVTPVLAQDVDMVQHRTPARRVIPKPSIDLTTR